MDNLSWISTSSVGTWNSIFSVYWAKLILSCSNQIQSVSCIKNSNKIYSNKGRNRYFQLRKHYSIQVWFHWIDYDEKLWYWSSALRVLISPDELEMWGCIVLLFILFFFLSPFVNWDLQITKVINYSLLGTVYHIWPSISALTTYKPKVSSVQHSLYWYFFPGDIGHLSRLLRPQRLRPLIVIALSFEGVRIAQSRQKWQTEVWDVQNCIWIMRLHLHMRICT